MNSGESSWSWSHLTWMMFGWWRDDGSIGNNDDSLFVVIFKMFLNKSTYLLECGSGSVWNTNKKVLASWAILLIIIDIMNTVDKDDAKMSFLSCVFGLELMERFGNFFFEISWFNSLFLDYLFSSIEHVW